MLSWAVLSLTLKCTQLWWKREEQAEKRKDELYTGVLSDLQSEYTANRVRSVERAGNCMNHWINVVPHAANNSVLGKDKFHDMVMLRYQITSKDLPTICDGCDKKHSLRHALQCIKGGLIRDRHDGY
eukprot:1956998-Ditylum_brightwellii.AAC.1